MNKKLQKRHKSEQDFHDNLAKNIKLNHLNIGGIFKSSTAPESQFALKEMLPIKGKKILDLGCGAGEATIYLAKHGAKVYAVDISPEMINIVKKLVVNERLKGKVFAQVMLSEKLKFPSKYFDYVFGRGVLHHVAIEPSLAEVKRVLKSGGKGIFIEPLTHNPVINVYRKIAKEVRTIDETPINYFKINKMNKANFKSLTHREFQLSTLLIFVWFFLVQRVSPNKERYWDKLINEEKKIKKPFAFFKSVDDILFRMFPFLRKYAWYTVLSFKK